MNGELQRLSRKRIAFSFDDRVHGQETDEEAMSSLAVEKASSVTGYCYSRLCAVVCSSRVLFVNGKRHGPFRVV